MFESPSGHQYGHVPAPPPKRTAVTGDGSSTLPVVTMEGQPGGARHSLLRMWRRQRCGDRVSGLPPICATHGTMKTCHACKTPKPISSFSWLNKAKGLRARECKDCHRTMRKAYYERNQPKEIAKIKLRRKDLRAWFKGHKAKLSCVTCGEDHPACLDFHHIDPATKTTVLCRVVDRKGWSKERILAEMAKYAVLCSNCHRKLHYAGLV